MISVGCPLGICRLTTATTVALILLLSTCIPASCAFSFQQIGGGVVRRMSSASLSLATRPRMPVTTRLFYETGKNSNDDKQTSEESEEDFQRRMALVRSLQMAFYTTSATRPTEDGPSSGGTTTTTAAAAAAAATATTRLDADTGMLHRLPLWRAPWWEVPGRSNVLNVHDPIYTNMFESILYKPPPWCFGHLYLEGGSRNLRSNNPKYQLRTWKNETNTMEDIASSPSSASAVLGALMHIKDYRRMADGRLLLLVHAMERFVVTDVHQQLPYSIVDAQILPDAEEVDPHLDFYNGAIVEKDLQSARAMAVQESVRFHSYEYDQFHCLQIPVGPEVTISDISHAAIAKVLPYCPFSKTLEPPTLETPVSSSATVVVRGGRPGSTVKRDFTIASRTHNSNSSSLEYNLLRRSILQVPPADPEYMYYKQPDMGTDELEHRLWLAINHFLVTTKKPVSPILLGLLPPNSNNDGNNDKYWPDDFVLHGIASSLRDTDMNHDFVPVSKDYPAHRRQRRLSFSAAYLLEKDTETAQALRATLLSIPSTKIRLRFVLEKFHQWQTQQEWGEFA